MERSYYGLERISRAAESIRQFQHAQLAITCLPAFAQSLLPAVCRTFHAQYPDVNFEIAPQESPLLEEWLSAQRYDLGITEHQLTPPGTLQETLLTLSEVCVLPESHPLCSKSVLTLLILRSRILSVCPLRTVTGRKSIHCSVKSRSAPDDHGNTQCGLGMCHGQEGLGCLSLTR